MVMSMFYNFMFPQPPSIFITAMSIISFVASSSYGISEIRGKHLNYSKFWNANNNKTNSGKQIKLSSKVGMLLLYTPAFLAGAVSFWIFPNEGLRSTILQGALTLHYFKRVFEVILDILYGLTPPSRFFFSIDILMISFNLRPTYSFCYQF
ncbi:hypothetical protein MtrunA17_Chr6g0464421 [Medicago truncatula]|uniref:Transmembrane protein n=1 Tax=Medicago truncatula TaxID=3880 RepID=A0A396HCQ6_MEDTR|nr:hypothetical protein MtrunA17_Chr6g0464421 [Medicago truncatula]